MATATAQSLSPAAREFVERGPQLLVVGGERLEAADGRTFETIDPATGEAICEVAFAGPEDVGRATEAARAALDGPLRKVSPSKRAGLMYALAELIKANGEQLAELESLDNGKPLGSARGTSPPASATCAITPAGRPRSRARRSRSRRATCSATRSASRSGSAPRSFPGTSRS